MSHGCGSHLTRFITLSPLQCLAGSRGAGLCSLALQTIQQMLSGTPPKQFQPLSCSRSGEQRMCFVTSILPSAPQDCVVLPVRVAPSASQAAAPALANGYGATHWWQLYGCSHEKRGAQRQAAAAVRVAGQCAGRNLGGTASVRASGPGVSDWTFLSPTCAHARSQSLLSLAGRRAYCSRHCLLQQG